MLADDEQGGSWRSEPSERRRCRLHEPQRLGRGTAPTSTRAVPTTHPDALSFTGHNTTVWVEQLGGVEPDGVPGGPEHGPGRIAQPSACSGGGQSGVEGPSREGGQCTLPRPPAIGLQGV